MFAAHGLVSFFNGTFGLSETRSITALEQAYLETIYGDSIDYSEIWIQQGGIEKWIGMTAHAIAGDIFMPDRVMPDRAFALDGSLTQYGLQLLGHEAGHTWQAQNDGADYIREAIASYAGDLKGAYDYGNALDNRIPWDELTPDQQAKFGALTGLAIQINGNGQVTLKSFNDAVNANQHGVVRRALSNQAELNYVLGFRQQLLLGEV